MAARGIPIRAFVRSRMGSSAVEFVLVTPLLFGLIAAAVDFSLAWSQKISLEQAAGRTAEKVTAPGTVQPNGYTALAAEAQAAYGSPITNATSETWLECDGVRQTSFSGTCEATVQTARYFSIVITADYTPIMGWGALYNGSGSGNKVSLTGDATVRIQ